MVMVAPLLMVSVAFAGGLGLLDLSSCALTATVLNSKLLNKAKLTNFFMVFFILKT